MGRVHGVAYRTMVGNNMRTYHGTPLAEIDSFTARFETYALQRALGDNLFWYAFPGTFLVAFLFEPFVTIFVPYQLMRLIVGSHPEMTGHVAEQYLASTPMDLSRYADLQLNITIAVLVFYFPGGFVIPMFLALACSHLFIIFYDHCRVLRSIPSCHFASMSVDWWSTWMLSLPCGLLLSCAIFKSNCQSGSHCTEGAWLILKCTVAFIVHVLVHTLLLVYVVPLFAQEEHKPSDATYKSCARSLASSWFNTNPIYCLRSRYIYLHDPPCDYRAVGKEHLLNVNESIGAYFEDEAASAENYDVSPVSVMKKAGARAAHLMSQVSGLPFGSALSERSS